MYDKIKQIANHYGFTLEADMAVEECSELIQAICKIRRGWSDDTYSNLKEEVADVLVVANYLRYFLGEAEIDSIMNYKLDRQLQRIEAEKNEEQGQIHFEKVGI